MKICDRFVRPFNNWLGEKRYAKKEECVKLAKPVFVVLMSLVLGASLSYASDENTRFTIDKKGVITDSETHLQWYVGPDRSTNWDQANAWVNELAVDGGGWRMPSSAELERICVPERNPPPPPHLSSHDLPLVFKKRTSGWFMHSSEHLITSCCCRSGASDGGRVFAVRSPK